MENSIVFASIIPRFGPKRDFSPPDLSDILPVFTPADPVGHGIAYSEAFEMRTLTLRRSTRVIGNFRLRPLPDRRFVEITLRFAGAIARRTNDISCDCPAALATPDIPCPCRKALLAAGGTAGYYAWLAQALHNSALVVCPRCAGLLDGTRLEVPPTVCLPCQRQICAE